MKTIDTSGRNCPEPVIMTRQALKDNKEVLIIVDNKVAKENISRFLKSQGHKFTIKEEEDIFKIEVEG